MTMKAAPRAIVVLDDQFQEIQRFSVNRNYALSPDLSLLRGQQLWLPHVQRSDTYLRLNLKTGETTALRLEMPAHLHAALADGTLYALDKYETCVYCFDPEGNLVSRHRIGGRGWLCAEDEKMYFWRNDRLRKDACIPTAPVVWRLAVKTG